jgi:hypothetical protein
MILNQQLVAEFKKWLLLLKNLYFIAITIIIHFNWHLIIIKDPLHQNIQFHFYFLPALIQHRNQVSKQFASNQKEIFF